MKMALKVLHLVMALCILCSRATAQNTAAQKSYLVVRASKNGGVLALVDNKNPSAITAGSAKIFPLDPGTYTLTLKDIKGNKFDTLINIINPADLIKEGKKPPFRYEVLAAESYGDDTKELAESAEALAKKVDNAAKEADIFRQNVHMIKYSLQQSAMGTPEELASKTENTTSIKKNIANQLSNINPKIKEFRKSVDVFNSQHKILKLNIEKEELSISKLREINKQNRNLSEMEKLAVKEIHVQKADHESKEIEHSLLNIESDLLEMEHVNSYINDRFSDVLNNKAPLSDSLKTAIKYHRFSDLKFFVNAQNADETKPDGNVFLIPYAVSQKASIEMLKYFIQLGARPNKYNRVYSGTQVYYTPLMIACKQNQDYEIIEFLLQSGARIYPEDASADRKKINTEHLYNAIKNNSQLLALFKRYDYTF